MSRQKGNDSRADFYVSVTARKLIRWCAAATMGCALLGISSSTSAINEATVVLGLGITGNYASYDSALQYVISPPSIAASVLLVQSFASSPITSGLGEGMSPIAGIFGPTARERYELLVSKMKRDGWSISCQILARRRVAEQTSACDSETVPAITSATIGRWATSHGFDQPTSLTNVEQGPTKASAVSILMRFSEQFAQTVQPRVQAGLEPLTYTLGDQPAQRAADAYDLYQGGSVKGVRLTLKGGEHLYFFEATELSHLQAFARNLKLSWNTIRLEFKKTPGLIQIPVSMRSLSYVSIPGQPSGLSLFGDRATSDFVQRANLEMSGSHLSIEILQTLVGDSRACCSDEAEPPTAATGIVSSMGNYLIVLESGNGRIDLVAGAKIL